jgi:AcrR family transcriptional regulator
MSDEILTPEHIIEVAQQVLRRFGLSKTTVVDVARALGVSHGSIYRHFPSKAALHAAITQHWLAEKLVPFAAIANEHGPALERLHRWLTLLYSRKQHDVYDDPELFATYKELASESSDVVKAYVDQLIAQVAQIIRDGVDQGMFASDDPASTAQAVFLATTRFHDPTYTAPWSDLDIETAFEAVWSLLLLGLRPRTIP